MRAVDFHRAFRAGERRGLAGGVQLVALRDGVGDAFRGAAAGARLGVGGEKNPQIRIGKNHAPDVASVHDQTGEAAFPRDVFLPPLVFEKEAADFGNRRELRDDGVDFVVADFVVVGNDAVEAHVRLVPAHDGAQVEVFQRFFRSEEIFRADDAAAQQRERDRAVMRARVHVHEAMRFRQRARSRGFPRRRAAVHRDHQKLFLFAHVFRSRGFRLRRTGAGSAGRSRKNGGCRRSRERASRCARDRRRTPARSIFPGRCRRFRKPSGRRARSP